MVVDKQGIRIVADNVSVGVDWLFSFSSKVPCLGQNTLMIGSFMLFLMTV
jgi:hypothetical protein